VSLGIYFHIPFCLQKCSYCHFLSFPLSTKTESRYIKAMLLEMKRFSESRNVEPVDSIYFGGGTPSLIPSDHIEQILEECRALFPLSDDCEISLEANPGTINTSKVLAYRKAGINRISMGAQSFNDRELSIIGRAHASEMIGDSLSLLRAQEFRNLNLDLILGLPEQSPKSWRYNLETFASLEIPHVSIYMLDLDDSSPLMPLIASGSLALPDEDMIADLYIETISFLHSYGCLQYEISNFARKGYTCRHNLKYWNREPVQGFGLGSHSFDGYSRFSNCTDIDEYCRLIECYNSPVVWREAVAAERALQESLFLGLRLSQGIDWNLIKNRYVSHSLDKYESALKELCKDGLTEWDGANVRLTVKGILLSNEIFQMFV
jgi:oxygen-independent coproporphyrinogen III oxidase